MVFGADGLRGLCRQMGVPVAFEGVSAYPDNQPVMGLFDAPQTAGLGSEGGGAIDLGMPELRLPYFAFSPMPSNTDEIIVAGVAYSVRSTTTEDDGAFLCYGLKLVDLS